jgi:hypothetical protein
MMLRKHSSNPRGLMTSYLRDRRGCIHGNEKRLLSRTSRQECHPPAACPTFHADPVTRRVEMAHRYATRRVIGDTVRHQTLLDAFAAEHPLCRSVLFDYDKFLRWVETTYSRKCQTAGQAAKALQLATNSRPSKLVQLALARMQTPDGILHAVDQLDPNSRRRLVNLLLAPEPDDYLVSQESSHDSAADFNFFDQEQVTAFMDFTLPDPVIDNDFFFIVDDRVADKLYCNEVLSDDEEET